MLASRSGLDTQEDSMAAVARKIAELVDIGADKLVKEVGRDRPSSAWVERGRGVLGSRILVWRGARYPALFEMRSRGLALLRQCSMECRRSTPSQKVEVCSRPEAAFTPGEPDEHSIPC